MITLTPAERDFLYHYRRESCAAERGPAHSWLMAQGIPVSLLSSLTYHEQQTDPRWLDRIYEDPPPPFNPPWETKEDFEARVWAVLSIYPKLREYPFAVPGSQPEQEVQ